MIICNMHFLVLRFKQMINDVLTTSDRTKWFERLDKHDSAAYLFIIMHRPSIDYNTDSPRFDISELVRNSQLINYQDVMSEIHALHMIGFSIRRYRTDVSQQSYTEQIRIHDDSKRDGDEHNIIFTNNASICADVRYMRNTKHVRVMKHCNKILTGYVIDDMDYCDKWDVDALGEQIEGVSLDDLTIDGHELNEVDHPQLADDPIYSPYLRTVEFRKQCIEQTKPNLSYSKVSAIALSLGITNIQNGKRLKKCELYDWIYAVPT